MKPTLPLAAVLVATLAAALVSAAHAAPAADPAVEKGRAVFMQKNCYFCHGTVGQGAAPTGVQLAPKPPTAAVIRAYVRHPTGQMPPYSPEILSDAEIDSIHAYLASIPEGPPASQIPLLGGTAPAKRK
jgi:ubiquinol-cytochrome c reductase cytochrome c subunit